MRLNLGVVDFGAAHLSLAHQVGGCETGAEVAEFMMDLALYVAGFVGMQLQRVRSARFRRCVVGRELPDFAVNQIDGAGGGFGIHRGDRSDWLSAIAYALPCQR